MARLSVFDDLVEVPRECKRLYDVVHPDEEAACNRFLLPVLLKTA